jgi:hypothetical protein
LFNRSKFYRGERIFFSAFFYSLLFPYLFSLYSARALRFLLLFIYLCKNYIIIFLFLFFCFTFYFYFCSIFCVCLILLQLCFLFHQLMDCHLFCLLFIHSECMIASFKIYWRACGCIQIAMAAAAAPSCEVKLVGEGPGGGKNCNECDKAATVYCPSCTVHYCNECFTQVHAPKSLQKHVRVPVEQAPTLLLCKTHGDRLASVFCEQCDRQVRLMYMTLLRNR